ncbi:glycosyltransferase family 4 protein [Thiomicrorhabdus sp. 6S3-12]|uniref:glycosyltransferase family 4 protein n=1 Tax=Thiomicrorhabdus sp. 6S3-12 TaxID=2819681 RepID=UPI001AACE77D|nr:glycosyltransferase family 4 protein [Thiomicrorhabdus sp. 6S3-12]MBO1922988.1 glycosyltransferase family 4 protein [Thiomicrorhabdus sp. 6S3-12]
MNVLYVTDHKFYHENGKVFSKTHLNENKFKRYLSFFENVNIVGRQSGADMSDVLYKNERSSLSFQLVDDPVKHPLKNNVAQKLNGLIASSDVVCIRVPCIYQKSAFKLAKKHNKKILIEMVGCPFDSLWNYGGVLPKFMAVKMYLSTRMVVANSDAVIYVTKKFLQTRYPNKKGITLGSSDVELPKNAASIRNGLHNKHKCVLGMIAGYTSFYKGFDVAFDALKTILSTDPNIDYELRIIGSGDSAKLKALISSSNLLDKVFLDGSMPAEKVFQWLDNIDVYLQPSRQEGLPRALVEAMSRGCPSIGSGIAGIPELLPQQYLINAGDYKSLAQKIMILANDQNEFVNSSRDNIAVSKRFDSDLLVNEWKCFMEGFLKQ